MPLVKNFVVNSPDVKYTEEEIVSEYTYQTTKVEVSGDAPKVTPVNKKYTFKTQRKVPKLGYVWNNLFAPFFEAVYFLLLSSVVDSPDLTYTTSSVLVS
jgi:hypothetical protein